LNRICPAADLPPNRSRVAQNLNRVTVTFARIAQIAVNYVNRKALVTPRFNHHACSGINLLNVASAAESSFCRIVIKR
jgi:hypothetical protein